MGSFDANKSSTRFCTATTPATLIECWQITKSPSTQIISSSASIPSPTYLTPVQSRSTLTLVQSISTPTSVLSRSTPTHAVQSRSTPSLTASNTTGRQHLRCLDNQQRYSDGGAILPPSPKRLKFINNDIDEQIEKAKKGTVKHFTVLNCIPPISMDRYYGTTNNKFMQTT